MTLGKKKILAVGSDSGIAQKFLNHVITKKDFLTTVSRRKESNFKNSLHYECDLGDLNEVEQLSKKISVYDLDVFIYFPGIFIPKDSIELTHDEIINQFNINLISSITLSIPVLREMSLNKKGMMIFIGSSSSYAGFKKTSIYCSAKHGLLGYTRSLCDEFRNIGLKIACISPGSINTKMSKPLHKDMDPNTFINPDEISELLINLVYSPVSSFWQEEIILKRLKY